MPKRAADYMTGQREMIARAALDVLIEKGYHETSLRDICRAANVSNGALYSYFPTREAVVIAACEIDNRLALEQRCPESWAEYTDIGHDELFPGTFRSRRFRLSLQFAAELSQMPTPPKGLADLFQAHRLVVRRSLEHLKNLDVVSLPLGLETTSDIHCQLFVGASYHLSANHGTDRVPIMDAFRKGLAETAGLVSMVQLA